MDYYNEFDAFPAQWLRNLIEAGEISQGLVDERSIKDVDAAELVRFRQCHFFCGIAGWVRAFQIASIQGSGVWTGSCPCQPFSDAGEGLGTADPRHLWPDFCRLISQSGPAIVFGEQVASKAGREWVSGVRADLEALGYAVGIADLCAAGVGAPHIRQRIYWGGRGTDRLTGYVTPSARDWKDTPGMATTATNPDGTTRARLDQMPRQVFGLILPSNLSMADIAGELAAKFAQWLMGFPATWSTASPGFNQPPTPTDESRDSATPLSLN